MARTGRFLFVLWLVGVVVAVGMALRGVSAQTPGAPGTEPIWKGVYTSAQAEKGESTYVAMCSRCHNPDLSGGQVGAQAAPAPGRNKMLTRWGANKVGR